MEFNERDDFVHNLLYAYFRQAGLAVCCFLLLFGSVFFMAWLLTPSWNSTAYLAIDPTLAPPVSRFADPTRIKSERMEAAYAYQVVQMLKGKEIALAVVKEFDLGEKLRQQREEPATSRERFHAAFYDFIDFIVDVVKFVFRIETEDREPDWDDKAARDFYDGLFAWVATEPVTDTDIVELEVTADSPKLANDIVDFMIDELRSQLVRKSVEAGHMAVKAFEEQLASVLQHEQNAEAALQQFMEEHGGGDPSESMQLKTVERDSLTSRRERLLAEQSELERQTVEYPVNSLPALSDRMLQNDTVKQMRSNLTDLRVRRAALVVELTEEHPEVVEVDTLIRETGAAIVAEVASALRTVKAELRQVEDQVIQLETELKEISGRQLQASRLQLELNDWQSLRRELQGHIDTLRITASSGISPLSVRLVDRMRVSPSKPPDIPGWMIVAVLAIIFATGGSVLVPPFVEYWRDPVRGPVDLLRKGVLPLAVIPSARLGWKGRLWNRIRGQQTGPKPERSTTRWHDLAAMLVLESREKGGRQCYVMTEAHERKAGAEICRHVAAQASRMGSRVVVLSIGSPEPANHRSIANANAPLEHAWGGVGGCLLLSLPAFFGAVPSCGPRPADWVADFDMMLIDAPEAGTQLQDYLSRRADGVILAVDSARRPLSEVLRLAKTLTTDGCRFMGVLLFGHSSPLPACLDRWNDRPD